MCEVHIGGRVWSLSNDDLVTQIGSAYAAAQQLLARVAELASEAHGRGLPREHGASSTATWLMQMLGCPRPEATTLVQLGDSLAAARPELEAMQQALSAGRINVEQARVIAATVHDLPREIAVEDRTCCAKLFTDLAADLRVEPRRLADHRRLVMESVAPEVAEKALLKQLHEGERTAEQRRGLTFVRHGDSEVHLRATMTTEAAAIIRAALDPLCAPGALLPPRDADITATADTGANAATASAAAADDGRTGAGSAKAVDGAVRDGRSASAKRMDALTEICRRALNQGDLPENGGEKPHLVITIGWEKLRDGVAAGILDTGELLTPATMRHLACDSKIIPAVLGGPSQPLDLGRTRRLIDGPLRRALVLRDRGCAFPNCDRPPAWCDGHHVDPWTDGGTTCLANSVMLCGFHHRLIHHTEWTVRIAADGHPEFLPPAHIDPERKPRRNQLHRRC